MMLCNKDNLNVYLQIMGETGKVVDVPRSTLCEVYFESVSRTYVLFIASLTKVIQIYTELRNIVWLYYI